MSQTHGHSMRQFVALILLSLCFPFVTSLLTQAEMYGTTTTSPDKIIRMALLYTSFICLAHSAKQRGAGNALAYIFPGIIILTILSVHQLAPYSLTRFYFSANKEILRVGGMFFFLVTAVVLSRNHGVDWEMFVKGTAILGILAGAASLYFSFNIHVDHWRQVGDYTRAGDGVMDANTLAAYLNMTCLIAVCGFLQTKTAIGKCFFLFSALISQVGRIFTFSTGGYLNLGISILVLLYLNKRSLIIPTKNFFLTSIVAISIILIFLVYSDIGQIALSRLLMNDEITRRSSLYSRVDQYVWFVDYYLSNPNVWFFGGGNSLMASLNYHNGLEIHNSPMRALAGTGLIGFLAYLYYIVTAIKGVYIKTQNRQQRNNQIFAVFLLASFIGWLVQSCTLPVDTSILHYYFITVSFALISCKNKIGEQQDTRK